MLGNWIINNLEIYELSYKISTCLKYMKLQEKDIEEGGWVISDLIKIF